MQEGATIPLRDYTSDVSWRPDPFTKTIDVAAVAAAFDAGATIVLRRTFSASAMARSS